MAQPAAVLRTTSTLSDAANAANGAADLLAAAAAAVAGAPAPVVDWRACRCHAVFNKPPVSLDLSIRNGGLEQSSPAVLPSDRRLKPVAPCVAEPEPMQRYEVCWTADGTALEPGQTGSASAAERHPSAKPPPTDLASAGSEPGDGADSKRAREEGSRPASPVRRGGLA